jgi:hypothetical protein
MYLRQSFIANAVFLIALVLIVSSSAAPQAHTNAADLPTNVAGQYRVLGTNPNGDRYTGSLEVVAHGDVYEFRWNAGRQYNGIGVRNGRFVAVAFANGSDGSGCGVVDYRIMSDGTLDGIWSNWGTDATGTERAKHVSGRGIEGGYAATGSNPSGTRYDVNLSVQGAGNGYKFVWSNNTEGFGIRRGDNIAVGFGGANCGFVAYQLMPDGSLDGVWGGASQLTGTEKATRQ